MLYIKAIVNNAILYNYIQNFFRYARVNVCLVDTCVTASSWMESRPVEFPTREFSGWKLPESACSLDLEPGSI